MTFALDRPEFLLLLLLLVPVLLLVPLRTRRKLSRRRWLLALFLRLALVLAAVLALCEPTLRRPVDDLAVVFVIDGSASVGTSGEAQALAFIDAALAGKRERDLAGAVVFGADAMVEHELNEELSLHAIESRPNPHQTDLAGGVRLATALLPADRTRRIVVLTDGEQTRGDVLGQALLATGDDLRLSVVAIGGQQGPEALLEDLIAPARTEEGAAYEVRVVARADQETTGTLRLYRNEQYLGEMKVELPADRAQVFSFRQPGAAAGLYRYRAQLEVDGAADARPENNQVLATVQVAGRPKVLLVERDLPHARHLVSVLEAEGLDVVAVTAADLPPDLPGLRPYAAVILSDIAAYTMARQTQEALESYVRDLGRGLVMIGGDESFGVGGWYETAVERALPVQMDISDRTRFPKLAMVLALDKSCSMGSGAGSKLGMAKEAAILTADLLSPRDSMGLVTFDAASTWVSPLLPLEGRKNQVIDDIGSIRSGGGTDIYPAVDAAVTGLRANDAALKHIVLLSDGMTTPGDFEKLIKGAHDRDQITLTGVAIGTDADDQTMKDMARWGGGNYYLVTDKTAIPAIFTREALLATRSFLIEEPFSPAFASPSDLTRGLRTVPFGELGGYVATQAKPRSTVAMVVPGEDQDPLLAHWRYGLGRSVAFTSDAKPRWASKWVGTEGYTRLWTQVVRWAVTVGQQDGIGVSTEIREGELVVTVDALDPAGGFRNFLDGEARVVAPDLSVHPLPLRQVGPGRYEARMPVDQDGSWLAGVQLLNGGDVVGQAVTEAVQPYSPEFRRKGAGVGVIAELGRLGGGGVTTDPTLVFARPEEPRQVPRPLWSWMLGLAGALLLFDVASRRLDLTRDPRAREITSPGGATAPRLRWAGLPVAKKGSAEGVAGEQTIDDIAPPPEPTVEIPTDSYAGRLLAARKTARDKMKRDGDP